MKLTYWFWLVVALGTVKVVNAVMPQIGWAGGDDDKPGMTGLGGSGCETIAAALNKLDGVSGVECGGYYPYLFGTSCNTWAAALNKLPNISWVSCDNEWNSLVVPDAHCPAIPDRLQAILQGPTCKHGNPVSGPTGGGNCTQPCDAGWQGTNCDAPVLYTCNITSFRCDPTPAPGRGANLTSCLSSCTK